MKQMKKWLLILLAIAAAVTLTACSGGGNNNTATAPAAEKKDTAAAPAAGGNALTDTYGFQWKDPAAPILNAEGAKNISFRVYSSKNASALDYNDMKIMSDLFAQTNVQVNWENVSESVYSQQKNLIFGNADNRPDAIYHAGMGAGEIIKYAKRKVLVPISDYLDYMPNFSKLLSERPDIKNQLLNVEDGKIYSLPRIEEMGLLQSPNLLFLNVAWTKAAIEAGAVSDLTADQLVDGLAAELRLQQLAGQPVRPVRYVRPERQPGAPGDHRRQSDLYDPGRALQGSDQLPGQVDR